jgi:hypothetical protein
MLLCADDGVVVAGGRLAPEEGVAAESPLAADADRCPGVLASSLAAGLRARLRLRARGVAACATVCACTPAAAEAGVLAVDTARPRAEAEAGTEAGTEAEAARPRRSTEAVVVVFSCLVRPAEVARARA